MGKALVKWTITKPGVRHDTGRSGRERKRRSHEGRRKTKKVLRPGGRGTVGDPVHCSSSHREGEKDHWAPGLGDVESFQWSTRGGTLIREEGRRRTRVRQWETGRWRKVEWRTDRQKKETEGQMGGRERQRKDWHRKLSEHGFEFSRPESIWNTGLLTPSTFLDKLY